jgi:hypothetical protein
MTTLLQSLYRSNAEGRRIENKTTDGSGRVMNQFELRDLKIEWLPIASLKPHSRNPRTHSAKQIRQIAESIRLFGFTNPVLVDRDGVIAGHGRIEGAKLLGIEKVPTICLTDMTESQKARLHH